jgi:hypothetical protein
MPAALLYILIPAIRANVSIVVSNQASLPTRRCSYLHHAHHYVPGLISSYLTHFKMLQLVPA